MFNNIFTIIMLLFNGEPQSKEERMIQKDNKKIMILLISFSKEIFLNIIIT